LKCNYCFVSAGDYQQNFIADMDYLLKWVQRAIEIKQCDDIEIHFAPYGEIFLYPQLIPLISALKKIPHITTISAQSNGLLLNPDLIHKLKRAGLNRMNISLNSFDATQCANLCGVSKYNLDYLLQMFDEILQSSMELLIAPVWFMGVNDQGIMDIIKYVKAKSLANFVWPKLRIGIQNYLTYKTGRKLKKIYQREFHFFYQRLKTLEKDHQLKLKLGPLDFGIHSCRAIVPSVKIGETINCKILSLGRWKNEYIGEYNSNWGVKILSKKTFVPGDICEVKIVKGTLTGNLLTGINPI
jgi:uncharacterized Fe-S cluster-containing radical SAM superfamily enzyme